MSRHMGVDGAVSVDGVTVAYITGWQMSWGAEILRHRGASEGTTTKYVAESERSGTFACESDPSDTAQTSLLAGGVQRVTLVLTEISGTSYTFDAIVSPSVNVPRSAGASRAFNFEETA